MLARRVSYGSRWIFVSIFLTVSFVCFADTGGVRKNTDHDESPKPETKETPTSATDEVKLGTDDKSESQELIEKFVSTLEKAGPDELLQVLRKLDGKTKADLDQDDLEVSIDEFVDGLPSFSDESDKDKEVRDELKNLLKANKENKLEDPIKTLNSATIRALEKQIGIKPKTDQPKPDPKTEEKVDPKKSEGDDATKKDTAEKEGELSLLDQVKQKISEDKKQRAEQAENAKRQIEEAIEQFKAKKEAKNESGDPQILGGEQPNQGGGGAGGGQGGGGNDPSSFGHGEDSGDNKSLNDLLAKSLKPKPERVPKEKPESKTADATPSAPDDSSNDGKIDDYQTKKTAKKDEKDPSSTKSEQPKNNSGNGGIVDPATAQNNFTPRDFGPRSALAPIQGQGGAYSSAFNPSAANNLNGGLGGRQNSMGGMRGNYSGSGSGSTLDGNVPMAGGGQMQGPMPPQKYSFVRTGPGDWLPANGGGDSEDGSGSSSAGTLLLAARNAASTPLIVNSASAFKPRAGAEPGTFKILGDTIPKFCTEEGLVALNCGANRQQPNS